MWRRNAGALGHTPGVRKRDRDRAERRAARAIAAATPDLCGGGDGAVEVGGQEVKVDWGAGSPDTPLRPEVLEVTIEKYHETSDFWTEFVGKDQDMVKGPDRAGRTVQTLEVEEGRHMVSDTKLPTGHQGSLL